MSRGPCARPDTLAELWALLAEAPPGARIVAGGTDLMVALRQGGAPPPLLINLFRLEELRAIRMAGGWLELGAAVTMARLLRSPEVAAHAPLLCQAADRFGSPLVRARATIGGNLCNASPAADLALALLALDAEVQLASAAGIRTLTVDAFARGPGENALLPGEIVRGVRVPAAGSARFQRFEKSGTRPALEISVAAVALAVTLEGGRALEPRIACGAVAPVPLRARGAEALLAGRPLTAGAIDAAARAAAAEIRPIDDVRGTALYRRRLVATFVRRALAAAREAASGAARASGPARLPAPRTRGVEQARAEQPAPAPAPVAAACAEVPVRFTLDGRAVEATVPPAMALLELVRERFQLTGAKLGCGEGECGACALLLDGEPVLGCLTPAVDVDGRTLTTVEGLRRGARLAPLQQAFVAEGAVQCGFCTPGMLIAASALLAEHEDPSEEQIRRGLEGNLCRCTGYRAIVEAVRAAARGPS